MKRAQVTPSRPAAAAAAATTVAASTARPGTKTAGHKLRASVERVAAGAGPRGVRVVDGEALLLDRVDEVDRGPAEIGGAHLVRDHLHGAELAHYVAVDLALVEVQLVAQAGAAARLHGDAQP